MKQVKFVGGPFHGTMHEVDESVTEMRLPVFHNMSLRYKQPNLNEFVFVSDSENTGFVKQPEKEVFTPDKVETKKYIFTLVSLETPETRGYQDQTDWCRNHIVVTSKHPCDRDKKIVYKVWSFMNDYSVELFEETKYGLCYVETKENRYITDYIYGLGKLLEQNSLV